MGRIQIAQTLTSSLDFDRILKLGSYRDKTEVLRTTISASALLNIMCPHKQNLLYSLYYGLQNYTASSLVQKLILYIILLFQTQNMFDSRIWGCFYHIQDSNFGNHVDFFFVTWNSFTAKVRLILSLPLRTIFTYHSQLLGTYFISMYLEKNYILKSPRSLVKSPRKLLDILKHNII